MIDYFNGLFSTFGVGDRDVLDLIHARVTEEKNLMLCTPFTREEIKASIFFMHPEKSPGPDGMNSTFFNISRRWWGSMWFIVFFMCSILVFSHPI